MQSCIRQLDDVSSAEGPGDFFVGLASGPTPQASDKAIVISLNFAVLPSLVSRQINLFRQRRPAPHPHIHLLRLAVAGQRFKPVEVGAIHQMWLEVEVRRDGLGELAVLARVIRLLACGSPCLRFIGVAQ